MAEPVGNELPDNESCGSCNNFKRCSSLFGCRFTSIVCDWIPSRFVKKNEAQPNLDPLAIAAQLVCDRWEDEDRAFGGEYEGLRGELAEAISKLRELLS